MMDLDTYLKTKGESTKKWINKHREEWHSDDQWFCHIFLNEFFEGFHHIPEKVKQQGRGIVMSFQPHYFSNYDYDHLTRLVIMSHNWGIRIGISGGKSGFVKLYLVNRYTRLGDVSERIPSIQDMVEKYKDK